MRPAYRVALVAALLVGALILLGLAFNMQDQAARREARRERMTQKRLERMEELLGDPDEVPVEETLDRIEAIETERLGAAEAAKRRRLRERLVQQRSGQDGQNEQNGQNEQDEGGEP